MWALRIDKGGAAAWAIGALLACCPAAGAATLRVTTTADGLAPPGGGCSLREAIAAVSSPGTASLCGPAGPHSNTIILRPGRYVLSIVRQGPDDNSTGDLDLTASEPVTIVGAGRAATVIDATGLGDRVLSISGGAAVTVRRLTITGGQLPAATPGSRGATNSSCIEGGNGGDGGSGADGGAIYNTGTLTLKGVSVTGNRAGVGGAGGAGGSQTGTAGCPGGAGGQGGGGGGISNWGRLSVVDSVISENRAGAGGAGGSGGGAGSAGGRAGRGGSGGDGGGINNQGVLSVTASTIEGNVAGVGGAGGRAPAPAGGGAGGTGASGGGIFSANGPLEVTNSTLEGNFAGAGGSGGGPAGSGGTGGDGGGIQVTNGPSTVLNATIARDGVGAGGSSTYGPGARGSGGGISVDAPLSTYDMRLENTIVASSVGSGCAANTPSAITGGHDLSFGDSTCPGRHGNPRLGRLQGNGGPTQTMALGSGSAAINRGAHCPATDQRGVRRPQGRGCDIGAFEFALPTITIASPQGHGSYERGSRVRVRFQCTEGGLPGLITMCRASVAAGRLISTRSVGLKRFTVTAEDRAGHRVSKTIRYSVWEYVNPMRAVRGLVPQRIDMGVDYGGSGPILALGGGKVLGARNDDSGPSGCLGRFCWPGGIVVYRLTDGPFAGKYVYVSEHITASVRVGETVRAGQRIAVLHAGSPNMETGWASSHIGRPLALIRGDECRCGDPGGWSSIEGRNFNRLLVALGAPSGHLQPNPPPQSMPPGWPSWP